MDETNPPLQSGTGRNNACGGDDDATQVMDDGIWNQLMAKIKKKPKEGKHRYIFPNNMTDEEGLDECAKERLEMQRHYLSNKIRTTKYTVLSFLPKNLFEQFHRFANCYFVFIVLLNFIPAIGAIQPMLSMVPVIVILLVQAIKDIIEDYGRYKSDGLVNNSRTEVYRSDDDKYHSVKWKKVHVGDIVRLHCNKVIPADVLLLHSSDEHGICFIETSNIDGETNLKQRLVCKGVGPNFHPKDFKRLIQCGKPNSQIDRFNGNIISNSGQRPTKEAISKENLLLRGCVIRNTDYVEGIVVYAGHETKAMLNNNGPRYKRSKLEKRMNLDVIWCVVLLVVMCLIGAVGNGVWAAYQSAIAQTVLFIPPTEDNETLNPALSGFFMFWTMVILLQVLIPISLYVSIEIVKVGQVYFINNDIELYDEETDKNLECRALNITEDLGQVQYVFSDKTGTLTENSMVFRRCTVGGVDYPHAANAARIENKEPTHPDMNPASNLARSHSSHPRVRSAQSLGTPSAFRRDDEHRSSGYRRPQSSSVRAHHRRNPSSLSVQQLRNAITVPGSTASVPNSPALKRATAANASHRKLPHKHHRRNISAVSAKEIKATLAQGDMENDVNEEIYPQLTRDGEEEAEEDEYLEVDVTPDPVLYKELESVSREPFNLDAAAERRRILDFFINLAICNTVVLSADNPELKPRPAKAVPAPSAVSEEKFRSLVDGPSLLEESDDLRTVSGQVDAFNNDSPTYSQSDSLASPSQQSFTSAYLRNIRYEAESPDEAALVYAAHAYGFSLAHRSKSSVTVTLPKSTDTITFEVLHTLTFDSVRKRMSVIVRDHQTDELILYCKGADSTILGLLKNPLTELPEENVHESNQHSWRMSYLDSNSAQKCKHTKTFLNQYARTGLRTLCIAKRVLTLGEYSAWHKMHQLAEQAMENREEKVFESYIAIEKDLELLGATGIEDRLQDGVPETIESLRKAGMQVWVITGDKQETAVNISYACKLIDAADEVIYLNADSMDEMKNILEEQISVQEQTRGPLEDLPTNAESSFLSLPSLAMPFHNTSTTPSHNSAHPPLSIVIDGKSLEFALSKDLQKLFIELARRCHSVLVCRATPLQKGEVVKLVKEELRVMTLAIGDGANDVSMIQVADIGVGISGQEGMQAVMSSDFAMAKFRFLQRLLLVHGHWNYARLAMMVLYFFYKNAAFVFLIFWFQFFCGYSGANPIEQWYLLLYSLLFTSVPPLINGVLDKDLSSKTLIQKPTLYMQGIKCEMYTPYSFWIHMLDAIYQSLALFFIPYFTYIDSDVGMITWGTPVTTACMFANLIHLGIETKTWTWIHWLGQIGSIVLFFAFSLIYNAVCPACLPPSNPYWITETLVQTTNFWFSVILATAIALLPRYLIRSLQSTLWPTECQKERVLEKLMQRKGRARTMTDTPLNTGSSGSSTHQNASYEEGQNGVVDALHYNYGDTNSSDPMYCEIHGNSNQNNRAVRPKSSPSRTVSSRPSTAPSAVNGLDNPAYINENSKRFKEPTERVKELEKEVESETGETAPDFLHHRDVANSLLRSSDDFPVGIGAYSVAFPPNRADTIESGALLTASSIDTFDNTVA